MAHVTINTKAVVEFLKVHPTSTARHLGLHLLDQAADTMAAQMGGESAPTNLALATFENALDWRLGLLAMSVLRMAASAGRHKLFHVEIRRGELYGARSGRKL